MATISSLEEIMIKKSLNFEIAYEELEDATVDLVIEICIKETNHVEESHVESI